METIYVKYSNERDKKFQIKTCINVENDKRMVYKTALHKVGFEHIQKICITYKLLIKSNKTKQIKYIEPDMIGDGCVEFPFVEGNRFSDMLISAIKEKDYEKLKTMLVQFQSEIEKTSEITPFEMSNEFKEIFKYDGDELNDLASFTIANIDLIPDNIFYNENIYTVIDYEWMYNFAVPCGYIGYRILNSIAYINEVPENIFNELCSLYNVDAEKIKIYEKMDASFQDFVCGSSVSLHALYDEINTYTIDFRLLQETPTNFIRKVSKVDEGKSTIVHQEHVLSTAQRYDIRVDKESNYVFEPMNSNCILILHSMIGKSSHKDHDLKPLIQSNAEYRKGDTFYFTMSNPQINFSSLDCEKVCIDYTIVSFSNSLITSVASTLAERDSTIDKCNNLESELLRVGDELAKSMEHSHEIQIELNGKEQELKRHVEMLNETRSELIAKHEECMDIFNKYNETKEILDTILNLKTIKAVKYIKQMKQTK